MNDTYKLVFRGEILDGQHPAVVRKRLAADFDDAALEKLFCGRPVVLKREADSATAARLQMLFKRAGARLRVVPATAGGERPPSSSGTAATVAVPATGASGATPAASETGVAPATAASGADDAAPGREEATPAGATLTVLPAGSDVLRREERGVWQPRELDTSTLALADAEMEAPDEQPPPPAPDVTHLSVADPGVRLGPEVPSVPRTPLAPSFDVAAPGADLAPRVAPPPAPVDFATLRFDVAPAGSDLGQRPASPPPEPPDTSHLALAEQASGAGG